MAPSLFPLILLIFSHVLADFVLQPDGWVNSKTENGWKSRHLYFHVCLAAFLAGIVTWFFLGLFIAVLVYIAFFTSHLIIDLIKTKYKDNVRSFVGDQAAHLVIIIAVWLSLFQPNLSPLQSYLTEQTLMCISVILLSYTIIFHPAGIFVSKMTENWRDKANENDDNDGESLENAGKYIGYLERFLILTFIISHQYTAIGLLIAAKSIFRHNTSRITGEYILFGTLLSFSIAIFVGFVVNLFLSLFLPENVENIINSYLYTFNAAVGPSLVPHI